MNTNVFTAIVKKYKKCPQCGVSYKSDNMTVTLENEIVIFSCKCGWKKSVNEKNEEVVSDYSENGKLKCGEVCAECMSCPSNPLN